MAITTLDGLISSRKQQLAYLKTTSVTTVAGIPFTLIDRAGFPLAGSLNPSNTTNGVVPTDATTGFPDVQDAAGSNLLYISRVYVQAPVAMAIWLYDVLFWAGQTTIPTSGTTTVALTSRPSFTSRIPYLADGTTRDFSSVSLWIQCSTATGNQAHSVSIDYLDQGGGAGNTGTVSTQNFTVNRLLPCPLASGDTGVSDLTGYNVNGIASATGSVSVMAMRSLGQYRVISPSGNLYGPDYTGMLQVFSGSAILAVCVADSTSSSTPFINIEVAQG
jgi:hypothetical protein